MYNLHWSYTNASEVFMGRSPEQVNNGLVISQRVCPETSTSYRVRVTFKDGTSQTKTITIKVRAP